MALQCSKMYSSSLSSAKAVTSINTVGGKKGNRTEPTDYTGRSLRKFPIVAVPGFTSVTEPNQRMRYLLLILSLFLFSLLD